MSASKNFPGLPSHWIEESLYINVRNQKVYIRLFKKNPKDNFTNKNLFVVHGFGEQSDRFYHWPFYLHTSVDSICIIDLPGHGKSEGTRGHIESFDLFTDACLAAFNEYQNLINLSKSVQKPNQFYWLGTSMGGLITLRTMVKHQSLPLKSVIVAEPQLGIAVDVPFLKEFFGVLIEPILGKLPLKSEIDLKLLSHDQTVGETYANNNLNHSLITPTFYVQMKKEMEQINQMNFEFPYPLYMMIPLNDYVVSWKKSFEFYKNLKMKNSFAKSLTSFPNFYHEIFNEIGKERAFVALENWLNSI